MGEHVRIYRASSFNCSNLSSTVTVASRREISGLLHWQTEFSQESKDHRFYELIEDTLKEKFEYG